MEKSDKCQQLKFNFEIDSVVNDGKITWNEISEIYEWNRTNNLPKLEKEQIVFFIIACDRDIEFTKKTIIEYFKARKGAPELFNNRYVELQELQAQLKVVESSIFPERTDDGDIIIYHKLYDTTFYRYHMEASMKLLFMTFETALYETPPSGLIFIGDMKGLSIMHLTRARIGLLKKFFHYVQEGLPIKLKAFHIVNCVTFIDKALAIVKPFIKKEVFEMVRFHPSNMDMDEFYEKHLPRKCLPLEFGGLLPSCQELHMENMKRLESLTPFFEAEEYQRFNTL